MDHDELEAGLGTSLDPKLMLAATTLLIAASVGTWKVFQPTIFAAAYRSHSRGLEAAHESTKADTDAGLSVEKKKRSKDRRKRAPVPKLPKALSQPSSSNSLTAGKKVIRQPSALAGSKKSRQRSPSVSTSTHEDLDLRAVDETPRPLPISQQYRNVDTIKEGANHPENVPLPPSPVLVLARPHSPPPPQPSPSASTSASTSGTPHTPPSIANSQFSFPALALTTESESPGNWRWEDKQTHAPSPVPKRGRKCPPHRDQSPAPTPPVASFPTLNTLPPPNTPLELQVEFMKNQVETYRAQEQANREREEVLLIDVDRLRAEAEQSRQDVSRLQWQLNDMTQREERLIGQINALTMQMQAIHQSRQQPGQPMPSGIPIPLYQPQSIPYPQPQGTFSFYHPSPHIPSTPYPNGSPMRPPSTTPTSVVSPTHLHPLMSTSSMPIPFAPSSGGTLTTPLAIETFWGCSRGSIRSNHAAASGDDGSSEYNNDGGNISYGLMEAIFKRPESYAASHGSRTGSGSVRSRSTRSPSESFSPTGSSTGRRSVHVSPSPSICGQISLESEGISVPSSSSVSFEPTVTSTERLPRDSETLSEEPEEEEGSHAGRNDDGNTGEVRGPRTEDQHTPGQDMNCRTQGVLHEHPPFPELPHPSHAHAQGNAGVQVYY